MKISVAMCTYNGAEFLPVQLESIFAQTRPPDEIVICDDGSTDETPEVLARHGKRVRVVRQENLGRSGARNTAVREARTPFVSFLDSDDLWCPDKLALSAMDDP